MASFNKRPVQIVVLLVVLLLLSAGGVAYYFFYIRYYVTTDNAYITGHQGMISSRVPGRVDQVLITDNQRVEAGQLLFTLDPKDYETALAQAEAALHRLHQEVAQRYAAVRAAQAKVAQTAALHRRAQTDRQRYQNLYERRTVSRETLDRVLTNFKVATAELEEARQEHLRALAAIGGSLDLPLEEQPAIKEAKAKVAQARLNLAYTQVKAPFTGFVTKKNLEPGNWLVPGQPVMMLIPLDPGQVWVQANFKETQLTQVCIGQPATIKVDTYPEVTFKGKVDSLMAGTGAAFALLPPENATGNWVKVVQRIPVKVVLLPPYPEDRPLRLGMSCEVSINTRERSGPRLLEMGSKQ